MKIISKLLITISAGLLAASCAKDIVDLTGDIQGSVKDYAGGQLIENCRVAISPGGKSTSTDANGSFSFDNLEAGIYSLSFSKSGYGDETQEVSVVTGQTTRVNVYMKQPTATTGSISGTIKDYANGQLISNCNVSLSPGGRSMTSSTSGTYEFSELTPGSYSITFSKAGYEDAGNSVTVVAGKISTVDILLKAKSAFALSENSYDFGDLEVSKTFYFFNNSDESTSFSISNIPTWLSFSKTSGTIKASGDEAITATVDRSKVSQGEYSQNVTISFSGKTSGSASLYVRMKKVVITSPSVSISTTAENIKQTSFDISGSITATGGAQVTSYGHCWNTTGNPTVNDRKTDLGATNAICTFKSTAENLNTYTTYYVRAYARNEKGISYSSQVRVTTQDVTSDKWDGNIASSFAGGSGTYIDPFIIKTGGQLLLVKNYSDKYFELGGNIDLNNNNWLPISFSGVLDGKGFSISNLYINRAGSNQGLFSTCSGSVSNLTIKQININASSSSYIGAISGSGGKISNCKVIFGDSSIISGDSCVGGISGLSTNISDCSVESSSNNVAIKGNSYVGGVTGAVDVRYGSDVNIVNCHVSCNIAGQSYIGGIVGSAANIQNGSIISKCSYNGTLTGEDKVGGISGGNDRDNIVYIKGCKVNASITATNGSAGGLVGYVRYSALRIIACYTSGNISATANSYGLAPSWSNLSYSVMTSQSSSFNALGSSENCATINSFTGGSNCKGNCTDITTFLKECYSDYASSWNFNKSWTWEGTVDGKTVKVKCPRLSWE